MIWIEEKRQALRLLSDIDGPLSTRELQWLYRKTVKLSNKAVIVELNPGVGQVTCCLALGCRRTARRVFAIWPETTDTLNTEAGKIFMIWHKNVIRKHLVENITPVLAGKNEIVPPYPDQIALCYIGQDSMYPCTAVDVVEPILANFLPNALVVRHGGSLLQDDRLRMNDKVEGSLYYGCWRTSSRQFAGIK